MDADIAVAFFFGSVAGAHFMIFIMAILAAGSRWHDKKEFCIQNFLKEKRDKT